MAWARFKTENKHVDTFAWHFSDGGSIPPASTIPSNLLFTTPNSFTIEYPKNSYKYPLLLMYYAELMLTIRDGFKYEQSSFLEE